MYIFFVLLTHSLARSAIGPNDPSVGKNAAILYEGLTGPTIGIVTPPGENWIPEQRYTLSLRNVIPHCFPLFTLRKRRGQYE